MRIIVNFFSILIFLLQPISAQADVLLDPAGQNTPQSIYDVIPDEFIEEAEMFGQDCAANSRLSQYYNCECLAAAYLDERIMQGPEAPTSSITLQLDTKCKDATGIAGKQYQDCFASPVELPDGMQAEDFCACYANTFATLFEKFPGRVDSRQSIALMSEARYVCRFPERAAQRAAQRGF